LTTVFFLCVNLDRLRSLRVHDFIPVCFLNGYPIRRAALTMRLGLPYTKKQMFVVFPAKKQDMDN